MAFRIYGAASGGSSLWSETHSSVSASSGRFSVILGSVTALNLAFTQDYWLSVQVGTDPEMSPRQNKRSHLFGAGRQCLNCYEWRDEVLERKDLVNFYDF